MAHCAQRPDGASNEHLVLGCLARVPGYLHAAMIEFRDALAHSQRGQLVAVGAKRVCLNHLGAGLDVLLMHAKDVFRPCRVQFVHAALGTSDVIQERTHRPIRDQNRALQPLIEFFNAHGPPAWPVPKRISLPKSKLTL